MDLCVQGRIDSWGHRPVCVHVCACMALCVQVWVHEFTCACMCVLDSCVQGWVQRFMGARVCVCLHGQVHGFACTGMGAWICVCTWMSRCMDSHVHRFAGIYVCAWIRVHLYVCMDLCVCVLAWMCARRGRGVHVCRCHCRLPAAWPSWTIPARGAWLGRAEQS